MPYSKNQKIIQKTEPLFFIFWIASIKNLETQKNQKSKKQRSPDLDLDPENNSKNQKK